MKDVSAKRVAGPFDKIPFTHFIQSPIGLVPKAGNKTRLIFHLSFNFEDKDGNILGSVNACMPKDLCKVKYNDIDSAIACCLQMSQESKLLTNSSTVYLGKTDLTSTFRVLPMKIKCFCWLVFKGRDPLDGKIKYFVDKCLPFGASISCSHYHRFSNSLKFIMEFRTGSSNSITNYLDDFLFAAITKWLCDQMIKEILLLCQESNLPVAEDKTEWACTLIVLLGILLDGKRLVLCIPLEKQVKALRLLNDLTWKKKMTVKQLQVLTGYLNFLTKAIVPGRTFTRRIYSKYTGIDKMKLKPYHHVTIDKEFRFDCEIW